MRARLFDSDGVGVETASSEAGLAVFPQVWGGEREAPGQRTGGAVQV